MNKHWTLRIEPDGENGRVDLPDELLALIGLKIGDDVEIVEQNGALYITPHRPA